MIIDCALGNFYFSSVLDFSFESHFDGENLNGSTIIGQGKDYGDAKYTPDSITGLKYMDLSSSSHTDSPLRNEKWKLSYFGSLIIVGVIRS